MSNETNDIIRTTYVTQIPYSLTQHLTPPNDEFNRLVAFKYSHRIAKLWSNIIEILVSFVKFKEKDKNVTFHFTALFGLLPFQMDITNLNRKGINQHATAFTYDTVFRFYILNSLIHITVNNRFVMGSSTSDKVPHERTYKFVRIKWSDNHVTPEQNAFEEWLFSKLNIYFHNSFVPRLERNYESYVELVHQAEMDMIHSNNKYYGSYSNVGN